MRLIDADALMRHLSDWALHDNANEIRECMDAVEEQPTIDTSKNLLCTVNVNMDTDEVLERLKERGWEPVEHGQWERHFSRPNVFADLYWHCSECGYKNEDQWAYRYHKYCPNCGARMDGDEE